MGCRGSGDDLLSPARVPTIIGAGAFHGPVREGKGWCHSAMVARRKRLSVSGVRGQVTDLGA